jgi:hypothetical protein
MVGAMLGARLGAVARGCGGRRVDFVAAAAVRRLATSREFWGCFILFTAARSEYARVESTAEWLDRSGTELVLTGGNDLGGVICCGGRKCND